MSSPGGPAEAGGAAAASVKKPASEVGALDERRSAGGSSTPLGEASTAAQGERCGGLGQEIVQLCEL